MTGSTGGRFRDALRQRDFRLLITAYIVDALGSWAYYVVLAVYVFDRTHSTEWLAAVGASRWITGLVVGGYAGVLADRYERTRVMVASSLASAVVRGFMAGVLFLSGFRSVGCPAGPSRAVGLLSCSASRRAAVRAAP